LEAGTLSRTEQAIIADLLKTLGQDVLKEAMDELFDWQGSGFRMAGSRVWVAESDMGLAQLEQPVVAEGDAEDVGGQILQGRLTGVDRLAMDDPLLLPGFSGDLMRQISLFQGCMKLGSK
jgi:hypothetical protein